MAPNGAPLAPATEGRPGVVVVDGISGAMDDVTDEVMAAAGARDWVVDWICAAAAPQPSRTMARVIKSICRIIGSC